MCSPTHAPPHLPILKSNPFPIPFPTHGTPVFVLTEPLPLPVVLFVCCAPKVAWGMHCLCSALKFLHEDCKFYHNNISTDTVFVTRFGRRYMIWI